MHAARCRRLGLALGTALGILSGAGCSNAVAPAAGGMRVLFIGNSLTSVNNLPRTLAALALSAGDTIDVRDVSNFNYALIDHYRSGTLSEFILDEWDYVVLQQGPSTTPINRDSLIQTAKLFEPHIRNAGGTPALYQVWPTWNRRGFADEARISYQMAADAVDGIFMPAGRAWLTAWESDPTLEFYSGDGLHPTPLGTYLAALVIYERLTGRDARQLPGLAVVDGRTLPASEETVRLLQRAAHETNALFPP